LQQISLGLSVFNVMVEHDIGLLKEPVMQIFLMPMQIMELRLEDAS